MMIAHSPRQILIVEDNSAIAIRYQRYFKRQGYRTQRVSRLSEARQIGRRHEWSLALLDIDLPDDSTGGIKLAIELDTMFRMPFIFVTAFPHLDSLVTRNLRNRSRVFTKGTDDDLEAIAKAAEDLIAEASHDPGPQFNDWRQSFLKTESIHREEAHEQLIDEIEKRGFFDEWQESLVFLAEETEFTLDQDARLSNLLHQLVISVRDNEDRDTSNLICSAIRLFASIARHDRIDRIIDFLEPGHVFDALIVSLNSLTHAFEASPPLDMDLHEKLGDRICEIAIKYLDEDVFRTAREHSIVLSSTVTLAAIGSEKLNRVVKELVSSRQGWILALVRDELAQLREQWRKIISDDKTTHLPGKSIDMAMKIFAGQFDSDTE